MRLLRIGSLPPAKVWIDRDVVMLHACFQILQDFVEKELVDRDDVSEIKFLYEWWLERKKNEAVDYDKEDDEMLKRLIKIRPELWT